MSAHCFAAVQDVEQSFPAYNLPTSCVWSRGCEQKLGNHNAIFRTRAARRDDRPFARTRGHATTGTGQGHDDFIGGPAGPGPNRARRLRHRARPRWQRAQPSSSCKATSTPRDRLFQMDALAPPGERDARRVVSPGAGMKKIKATSTCARLGNPARPRPPARSPLLLGSAARAAVKAYAEGVDRSVRQRTRCRPIRRR